VASEDGRHERSAHAKSGAGPAQGVVQDSVAYIEEPSIEPSREPPAEEGLRIALPSGHYKNRLVAIGISEPEVAAWFVNAHFTPTPVPRWIFPTRMKAAYTEQKFGSKLRKEFGEELKFDFVQ
jgi:hypothetical protein